MAQSDPNTNPRTGDVALIVGGGPGISASCARLFAANGMKVAIAARSPDKPVLYPRMGKNHSHSIVPGGLLVTSYTTLFTPFTSLMMRVAVSPRNFMSNW